MESWAVETQGGAKGAARLIQGTFSNQFRSLNAAFRHSAFCLLLSMQDCTSGVRADECISEVLTDLELLAMALSAENNCERSMN